MSHEIMAFLEDIFYTAKIREVARSRAKDVRFVRDLTGLERRLAGPVPEVVLVDLSAESLRPLELIRRLKERPEWTQVRVVAWSTSSQPELMQQAAQAGADLVLSKSDIARQLPELLQGAAL